MSLSQVANLPVLDLEAVDVPSLGDADRVIVRGVDWHVKQGESWLVAGPPGTGKSSLLSVAAGLVRPARGRHRLFGAELALLSEREQVRCRLRVGVVFGDEGRLFTRLTVTENLTLPLGYHARVDDEAAAWVATVLKELGLNVFANRLPAELPRSYRPRVALARALMLKPDVLVLDDPAAGILSEELSWWLNVVRNGVGEWKAQTLIIAASNPQLWTSVAERFALVKDGNWRVLKELAQVEAGLRPAWGD